MDISKTILEESSTLQNLFVKTSAQGKCIGLLSSKQKVSGSGRIILNKKGWIIRILSMITLIALLALYNYFGTINPEERPIMIYTSFVVSLSIIVYIFGWIFYKNPSTNSKINLDKIQFSEENLFSIIIPVYNQEKLIETVITSAFSSTYKNIEVIAVDDESTDGSDKILDYLKEKKYPDLKVIHKKNEGKRKAVASGFQLSVGNYIILIDSDSIIDKYAIGEFAKVFLSNPSIGSVAGQAKLFNAKENLLTKCQDSWYDYEYNIYKTCESYFGAVTCCSGCLAGYRREAIENVLTYWSNENEDGYKYGDRSFNSKNYEEKKNRKNKLESLLLGKLYNVRYNLLKSLLSFDDSEDRALTTYCLMKWKSVYLSTAVAYTDVPNNFDRFLKQQQRWKKGYLRANLFASIFFLVKEKSYYFTIILLWSFNDSYCPHSYYHSCML